MAPFSVTIEALARLRRTIEEQPILSPLVGVSWWNRGADLIRTPEGEATWVYEKPRWMVAVLDLDDIGGWPGTHVELHGLRFALRGKPEAPNLDGCVLDVEDGEFVVREDPF